jgi:hypothetical protein
MLDSADRTLILRSVHWNADLGTPTLAPSTSMEWEAIAELDRDRRRGELVNHPRPTVRLV